ncbi:SusE domain-containing protein [Flavobacterium wongokense]|uniref:SusE domain-containing protein n=1 Tax=Flavobacterium wongokense TaxID=2910674 RepID=UPI001F209736|nr:SusE domain-containing protein [Flavobacterium sp. WG47]MCF6131077.1 SusE domain-containing protein [Flavobacterium sp. WG47]
MKNSIKLLIAFVGLFSFSACTEDVQDTGAVVPESGLKLLTPNSGFNIVVDGTKLSNLATTFVWTDSDNPTGTDVTYTVEAAVAGTDFAAPLAIGTTTEHFLDVTAGTLDSTAKALGLEPRTEGLMDVRISAPSGVSNSFTLKVTPYQPNWGIIGSATPLGWDNSTAMTFNPITETYSISLALTTGEFKFRLDNSWTTNYGDDGNNLSLEANGGNIPVTAGNYTIVADFVNHTYTITAIPDAWGIIGDATTTGWGSDTLMDWNPVTMKYSIIMNMSAGSFKFRLNHDWGTNYGDDGGDLTLDNGGGNIPIAAPGTYLVTADFTGLTYTITQL